MTARAAAILVVGCALLAVPGPAVAATISVGSTAGGTNNSVIYFSGNNEANALTVTLDADTYTFTDAPGVNITPLGPPCTQGGSPNVVTCPAAGIIELAVNLGNLDDSAVIATPTATQLRGDAGADSLTGGTGNDLVIGDSSFGDPSSFGNDALEGGPGNDELFGDSALVTAATGATNVVSGGPGGDSVTGGGGPDTLRGGDDGDRLFGYAGVDDVDGGEGPDALAGGDANDLLRGGGGNDELGDSSTSGPNGFPPDRGNDVLEGGPGDDLLRAGLGPSQGIADDDSLSGGDGSDTVTYEKRAGSVLGLPVTASIDGAGGDGFASESDNVGLDVERLLGGGAADRLSGGPNNDAIDGLAGADTITGGNGNDSLDGGTADAESDRVSGGPGDDAVRGNAGDDSLNGDDGVDTVQGGGGDDQLSGGDGADALTGGAGADRAAGGAGNDTVGGSTPGLVGVDGKDTLRGNAGDDALSGGAAGDTLIGGTGADAMAGGAGRDTVDYSDARRAVKVTLDGRANDGQRRERDNVGDDVENVRGGGVRDTFTGDRARNVLDGGAGEDFVDGRRGRDRLRGGVSRDVVRARDGARDVIDCGRSSDFAIVDRKDVVRNCERSDAGGQQATVGRDVVVRPKGRGLQFGLPRTRRTVPLLDRIAVPVATDLDTRRGTVRLTSARGRSGRQTASFSAGLFTVLQSRSGSPITELRLKGGNFGACGAAARGSGAGARASQRRTVRRLRGNGRGRFRTRGRHSAATVRGTDYTVADRCDGTLTTVRRGVVLVRDFRLRRTIRVRAGQSYLARARG